jgi:hypothetical protein
MAQPMKLTTFLYVVQRFRTGGVVHYSRICVHGMHKETFTLALALPTQHHTLVNIYQTTWCYNPEAIINRRRSVLSLPTNCLVILCVLSSWTKSSEDTFVMCCFGHYIHVHVSVNKNNLSDMLS